MCFPDSCGITDIRNLINDGKCYTTSYDNMKNKIYHTRKNSIFNGQMVERGRIKPDHFSGLLHAFQ